MFNDLGIDFITGYKFSSSWFEKRIYYISSIFVGTKIGLSESYLLKVLLLINKKCFCEGTI